LICFNKRVPSSAASTAVGGAVLLLLCWLQSQALMDLQKRFVQQERQLQASLAAAAGSNASEGADVEPYFPKERVQLEQDMLHKVGKPSRAGCCFCRFCCTIGHFGLGVMRQDMACRVISVGPWSWKLQQL
jgi:hypothetical protein